MLAREIAKGIVTHIPGWLWRLIVGRRPYLINRAPPSEHLRLLRAAGFEITLELHNLQTQYLDHSRLAPRWRSLEENDRRSLGAFIQARKPALPAS